MAQLIPALGAHGLYTLSGPFAGKLLDKVPYTCAAVRRLGDIIAAGADPKETYYTANGLDAATYESDLAANVAIVSLSSRSGSWVYVPSSFIARVPDQGGIPYTTMMLAVSLSAVPDALDLSYLKSQVKEVVQQNLGVVADVHEVIVSAPTQLSQTEHAAVEAARLVMKQAKPTLRAQLLASEAALTSARQKIAELEAYILSKA